MIANGPWTYEIDCKPREAFGIEDANGGTVLGGCGCCGSPYLGRENTEEIARLLGSAPELLEMCERLYMFASAYADKSAIEAGHGFLESAKDLIAKVKGN